MPKDISIIRLVRQLVQDALAWSQAEIELTRKDAMAMVRNYIIALALIFVGFAMLIAALLTLAQTVIGAIATYVQGHTLAGLIVSVALFGLAMLVLILARYFFTRKSHSMGLIFRRISGEKIE